MTAGVDRVAVGRRRGVNRRVRMHARCRHSVTVLTVDGDVDGANVEAFLVFSRRKRSNRMAPFEVRVVVGADNAGGYPEDVHRMIHRVNWCTHGDGIVVRHQPLAVPSPSSPVTNLESAGRVRVRPQ